MSTTYRVVIKGVKNGITEEQVVGKLAPLFKTSEEQIRKILGAKGFTVKKGLDLQVAAKYQAAIEASGAAVVVEPENDEVLEFDLPKPPSPSNTKKCHQCGFELPIAAKFCRSCGANQLLTSVEKPLAIPEAEPVPLQPTSQPAVPETSKQSDESSAPVIQSQSDRNDSTQLATKPNNSGRKKLAIVAVIIVATVAMAGTGYVVWNKKQNTDQPDQAAIAPTNTPQPETETETSTDRAMTVAGELMVTDKKDQDDLPSQTLNLAGKVIYDQGNRFLSIEKSYNFAGRTVLLLSKSSGGTACPGTHAFMTVQQNGEVAYTSDIGSCSDIVKVTVNHEEITATIPDIRGRGDESWTYKNDALKQTKFLDPNIEANAVRIKLDNNSSALIKGTIGKASYSDPADGERVEFDALKLPSKSIIQECDQHSSLIDWIQINQGVTLPKIQGESEFQVTIQCSNAGAGISAITIPSESSKFIPGQWHCTNDRNKGDSLITFGPDGSLDWLDDAGKIIESHRLGTYQINQNRLAIEIKKLPLHSKLGRSPNVSISEGAEVKSIDSASTRFVWWQNSDPNDKVTFSCSRTKTNKEVEDKFAGSNEPPQQAPQQAKTAQPSQEQPQQQSTARSQQQLPANAKEQSAQASKCADPDECINVMLEAIYPRNDEAVQIVVSRLGEFNRAHRGDRKLARQMNTQALEQLSAGNHAAAIELLKKATEADPADVEILSNLGYAYMQAKQPKNAGPILTTALLIDPKRTSTWVPLATVKAAEGKSDLAIRAMLLGYEFSTNKEKTVSFFTEKANSADSDALKAAYAGALERISLQNSTVAADARPKRTQETVSNTPTVAPVKTAPSRSAVMDQVCARGKAGCYGKGALAQSCLNALRGIYGCD